MPLYQAIVLAIVQGLTEFLPISSTAHLTLFPWLLGWKDPGLTFDIALHAGTLVAVLVYFWRYWLEMFGTAVGRDWGGNPGLGLDRKLLGFLAAATIPAGVAGWLFESAAEEELRSPFIIGVALVVLHQVGFVDSVLVGVAQAFAVIPGVSRSGATMTAGLFRGMKRDTAARLSFLLFTPIIAGAALKKGLEIRHTGVPHEMVLPFVLGIIVAAVVGYLVIAALIRYLERRTFRIFIVYRVALGVLVLALGWGLRHA
ncbi:MAG: undecaprenyl-diphosphate phosphatase [Acidobacteriia bacterium]|nr:undecaprenyl-diphosphate phosphatase [Terriglobia bacterium]